MRTFRLLSGAVLMLAAVACGQPANNAQAQPNHATATAVVPAAPAGALGAADKTAILTGVHLHADARGLVMNECGDAVTPQYIPADVGLGQTILFVMVGGPNGGYSCYGDGPDLHLMKHDGAAWREIYATRGGMIIILPTTHNGAHDLAFGGPGMSHATSRWTGTAYGAGPDIADDAIPASAPVLPAN